MDKTSIYYRRWRSWGIDAAERAVKTVAQTAVALLGTGAVDLTDLSQGELWSASFAAGALSLLTSLASKQTGFPDSAGLDV